VTALAQRHEFFRLQVSAVAGAAAAGLIATAVWALVARDA
jgi:hypothetical protein